MLHRQPARSHRHHLRQPQRRRRQHPPHHGHRLARYVIFDDELMILIVVAFASCARISWEGSTNFSPIAVFFIFFFKWRASRDNNNDDNDNDLFGCHHVTIDLLPGDSSAHLDKRSKQHLACSNSRFNLHSPKGFSSGFRKQYGHVVCSHFIYCLRRRVCTRAVIG